MLGGEERGGKKGLVGTVRMRWCFEDADMRSEKAEVGWLEGILGVVIYSVSLGILHLRYPRQK